MSVEDYDESLSWERDRDWDYDWNDYDYLDWYEILLIVLGCVIAVCLVVLLIWLFFCRNKKQKDETQTTTSATYAQTQRASGQSEAYSQAPSNISNTYVAMNGETKGPNNRPPMPIPRPEMNGSTKIPEDEGIYEDPPNMTGGIYDNATETTRTGTYDNATPTVVNGNQVPSVVYDNPPHDNATHASTVVNGNQVSSIVYDNPPHDNATPTVVNGNQVPSVVYDNPPHDPVYKGTAGALGAPAPAVVAMDNPSYDEKPEVRTDDPAPGRIYPRLSAMSVVNNPQAFNYSTNVSEDNKEHLATYDSPITYKTREENVHI